MVTFEEGTTVLGQAGVDSNGNAAFTTSTLTTGPHTITAVYYSDAVYATSTGATNQIIQDGTSTSVSSAPTPSVTGQGVSFTATVTGHDAGAGNPSGSVTFTEGSTTLTSAVPLASNGTASFTTSALLAGPHTITATFSGNTGWLGSSGDNSASPQLVNKATTTTAVTTSGSPSPVNTPVTFTATVTVNGPGSQAAANSTGTVTFYDQGNPIGTGTLSNSATDTATFTTKSLAPGDHHITAAYTSGDANFTSSPASSAITQTINEPKTTTSLTASATSVTAGHPVAFTAHVLSATGGQGPTTGDGTITFNDGNTPLGSVAIDASGQAVLTTTTLSGADLGTTHSVTATYNGDARFFASSSTPVSVSVQSVNGALIVHWYEDLLHRNPLPNDMAGFQYWVTKLNTGSIPEQVVLGIENSDEYRQTVVASEYQLYLHRGPNQTESANGVAFLRQGGTDELLAASLLGSSEYFSARANSNDSAWVQAVYNDVLQRSARTNEVTYWIGQGGHSVQAANLILASTEARTVRINSYYYSYLHRFANVNEDGYWLNLYAKGATDEVIQALFLISGEYAAVRL
jgi:hypothetical protein